MMTCPLLHLYHLSEELSLKNIEAVPMMISVKDHVLCQIVQRKLFGA